LEECWWTFLKIVGPYELCIALLTSWLLSLLHGGSQYKLRPNWNPWYPLVDSIN
jgi:hypothetical protein